MKLSIHYIDLTKYSLVNISAIADENELDEMNLYDLKKRGYNKVWIDVNKPAIVATSKPRKNKKDHISLTKVFVDRILSMGSNINSGLLESIDKSEIRLFKFDLTEKLDNTKLICEKLNMSYDCVVENRNAKITTIWMTDTNKLLFSESYGCSKLPGQVEDIFQSFPEWALRIPKNIDVVVDRNTVVLDLDHILDKISAYGINVLTKEEKSFLDNQ